MATLTPDRTLPPEPQGFELPSHNLPAVETRDLPEPVPFRKVAGASVIILATAIGSGEFVLWPYITSQVGLVFMWAAIVGFLIQFFINMEVERYTLATGETALTGFAGCGSRGARCSSCWRLCQNFWPGWATGAATTLTFVFGGGDVVTITVLALISIGIALTASPVVYQTTEKAMGVMVVLIMAFVVIAVVMATRRRDWGDFATSFTEPEIPVGGKDLTIALLLGALAFAGAGGANNLVQSNYIRDKNMGMGERIPHIVSPITGEEEADAAFGYTFTVNDENMRRWRRLVEGRQQGAVHHLLPDRRDVADRPVGPDLRDRAASAPARRELRLHPGRGQHAEGRDRPVVRHRVLALRRDRAVLHEPRHPRLHVAPDRRPAEGQRHARTASSGRRARSTSRSSGR